nr:auxilin-like protein [Tanacetum cinerariifolium]
PVFGDWKWRLATLPIAFERLGVYSAGDVLNYAFIASRLQTAILQTSSLRHFDIVTFGPTFDNALGAFNEKMEIDLLSNTISVLYRILGIGTVLVRYRYDFGSVSGFGSKCSSLVGLTGVCHDIGDHVLVSLVLNIGITLYAIPLSTSVFDRGFQLEKKWILTLVKGGTNPYVQLICCSTRRTKGLMELEKDVVTLLKRIRKFFLAQDARARDVVHIFSKINFVIARMVGQIVSRFVTNFL